MPEEYLQTAFEIKAACDEISRRLLRWHWEQKPGAHSLESLIEHLETRRQESPVYYDRLPDLNTKTSWQQLDTTLCMRILLDPEKDAAHPLDLLGSVARPAAARRACNAVRTARNEAAHAGDRAGSAQAAILFNEAVECLEDAYSGTALRETELSQYYRQAEGFLARCGKTDGGAGAEKSAQSVPENAPENSSKGNQANAAGPAAQKRPRKNTAKTSAAVSGTAARGKKGSPKNDRSKTQKTSATTANRKRTSAPQSKKRPAAGRTKKKETRRADHGFWILILLVAAAGLLLRALRMGILNR
ncbi:MAG: hypothetical protein ACI4JC_03235 [Faecalibacterium sp.]